MKSRIVSLSMKVAVITLPLSFRRIFVTFASFPLRQMKVRPVTTSAQSAAPGIVEPLTAREVEILRLITARMTNQEIVDRLFNG